MRVCLRVSKEGLKPGMVVTNERTGQTGEVTDVASAPWGVVVFVLEQGKRQFVTYWRVADLTMERIVGEQ